jgi:predicted enzyme related to lactoylglutathione lyase
MERRIAVVIVGVTDMQRALDFYQRVLHLPLKFQTATYSELSTDGAVLALEKRSAVACNGPIFTLPTTDIAADERELRAAGVKFWKEVRTEDYGQVLMPFDSEGNIFEIVQYVRD